MKQGTFLHNNWLLSGIAAGLLIAAALASTVTGELSVEVGGVAMSFQSHEEGGVRLFFVLAS
jgi:hypothetical protein